ncbi:MAG TPA: winged helix-turn-helix domain-containing protein [Methanomassiliicoccales archaeon]|jgi:DNA-binding transcriptional ArsR family regulator
MQADDIREQIEALRQEVRGLSNSILNLRQDDMRKVFGDQIRPVLMDRIERHYSRLTISEIQAATPRSSLTELVDQTIATFQQEGRSRALDKVEELEKGLAHGDSRFEAELIAQLREYIQLSETIFNQTVPEVQVERDARNGLGSRSISPDSFERLLAPLSNAKRVQVMMLLSRESNSLAELCKELELQKGHLQFHLKALLDVNYIRFDRKSRLYSMTPRGTMVLERVAKLMDDLMALP